MNEYENCRRIVYEDGATFVPVCQKCGRFVKAPANLITDYDGQHLNGQAQCSKCGKTDMLFEGYY